MAADQDYADAKYVMVICYYDGYYVDRDKEKGCQLFREAGEQGIIEAVEKYSSLCNPN